MPYRANILEPLASEKSNLKISRETYSEVHRRVSSAKKTGVDLIDLDNRIENTYRYEKTIMVSVIIMMISFLSCLP